MKTSHLSLALIATLAFAACHRGGPAGIAHRLVGDDNQELRQAFNADVDKVRVIMLVAPS